MARKQVRCKHCGRLLFLFYHPLYGSLYGHPSAASGRRCREAQRRAFEKQKERELQEVSRRQEA